MDLPTWLLFLLLFVSLLCSAFFSSSETAMMSIDRYRLKYLVNLNKSWAIIADELLKKPDRLIGVILLGNNFFNIFASSISTLIALRLGGDYGLAVATGLLTFVILVFCEVAPKTFAAQNPEIIIALTARLLWILKKVLFPITIIINSLANFTLWLMGKKSDTKKRVLNAEQLKVVLTEGQGETTSPTQKMVLNLLELENINIQSIMTPNHEIVAINTRDSEDQILQLINNSPYNRLPIYEESLEQLIGTIHIRDVAKKLPLFSLTTLIEIAEPCHYVPEKASLSSQLRNFQENKQKMAFVVDEYGNVKGLVTIDNILEEIVGDYTTNITHEEIEYERLENGSINVHGEYSLRDLFTEHKITLESEEATTLHGFVLELYGDVPPPKISLLYEDYILEVLEVSDDFISLINLSKRPPANPASTIENK